MLPQVTPFDSLGMAQPVLWPTVGLGSGSCLTGGCGPAELFFGVVSSNLFSVLRLQSFGALSFLSFAFRFFDLLWCYDFSWFYHLLRRTMACSVFARCCGRMWFLLWRGILLYRFRLCEVPLASGGCFKHRCSRSYWCGCCFYDVASCCSGLI